MSVVLLNAIEIVGREGEAAQIKHDVVCRVLGIVLRLRRG